VKRAGVLALAAAVMAQAQAGLTDRTLIDLSEGRTVRVGSTGGGGVAVVPLELYVARVLAGEGEPRAAEAAQDALAVAIRTYALANTGRHEREGFDLCDSVHCQVPRAPTPASRRAAYVTAGRILLYDGRPAELFYSASCGGQSESAAEVFPAFSRRYLSSAPDDVHADDEPWRLELTLAEIQRGLQRAGFTGDRLTGISVDARNASGRVARLELKGLQPAAVAGDQFRAALGTTVVRSTAFTLEHDGTVVRFTGRGYGHGVGLCVIGAGRRAVRGEPMDAILSHYYPGLTLTPGSQRALPAASVVAAAPAAPPAPRRAVAGVFTVAVPLRSSVSAATLEGMAAAAFDVLSARLGTTVAPITIRLHESVGAFAAATGGPGWSDASVRGTVIDLAPASVLAQRNGVEAAVRRALAELLVGSAYAGRPEWLRVGAARYFARTSAAGPAAPSGEAAAMTSVDDCPSDDELTAAASASAQEDAQTRAEACFARAFAKAGDWRAVP
jgi:SpoIID/LytB domain protein